MLNEHNVADDTDDAGQNHHPADELHDCAGVEGDEDAENQHAEGENENVSPRFDAGGVEFDGSVDANEGFIYHPDADDDAEDIGDVFTDDDGGNAHEHADDTDEETIIEEIFLAFNDEIVDDLVGAADDKDDAEDVSEDADGGFGPSDEQNPKNHRDERLDDGAPS